jgi:alpha-glucoside transport system permease protein
MSAALDQVVGRVRAGRPSSPKLRLHPRRLALHATLAIVMIGWLLPTMGMLVNSVRSTADVSRSGWWTALTSGGTLTLENYAYVLDRSGLGRAFVNSLMISIPSTVIPVTLAAFAGYAFAWLPFRGRDWLFVAFVGLLAVPLQVTLVPVLRLFRETGISGEFVAVWLAGTAYAMPFSVLLMRNAIAALPREVMESAAIDGAGHGRIFRHLVVPMAQPAIGALAIFQFLFVWNDLLVTLVIIGPANPANQPLTVVVANLSNSLGGNWHYLMAAAFLTALLPLLVFFVFQRAFVRGITAGSVKG